MAKKADIIEDFDEKIIDVNVSSEMETSFLEYSYSVIYSRALPDARDGLKPVQRRILYSMNDMGINPDKPHVKSARVVGQVMGLLHPHGDASIYDALVKLAQPWSVRLPMVDGHGNFGSLDAGPAAMRYTECRMATPAKAMTNGIDEDTVDFRPNYDGKALEPTVLPSQIPNLLVNGAKGIAVGMATNMAPHNLVEVVQGLKYLLRHPEASVDELMRFIPGPDLPSGGKIVGLDGIRQAYETGNGTFKMRATARIEAVSARKRGIVFTELPYMVGPEQVIEQLKKLVQAKKLTGISDVKDLTDLEHGTRLVVEVKNGINPEALLAQLYKQTKLEDSFAINNVALVDGQPQTLSLKALMEVFLAHRKDVTLRQAQFRLNRAEEKLHLVEGFLVAVLNIDDIIQLIRSSETVSEARQRLITYFELTEPQANAILDMQLRRLTKMSQIELEKQREELNQEISSLQQLLSDDEVLRNTLILDLDQVAQEFGTPRRTVLLESDGMTASAAATEPLEVADDPCWIVLSSSGMIARTTNRDPLPTEGPRANHDVIAAVIPATARGDFGVITSAGNLIKAKAIELPTVVVTASAPNLQGGSRVAELYPLEKNESVVGITSLNLDSPGVALGTAQGVVKRVKPELLSKDSWSVISLAEGDSVIGAVELGSDAEELCFITSDAQLLHFSAALVRPQGRNGSGIAGIRLADKAKVISFTSVYDLDSVVVTVSGSSTALPGTQSGMVKVSKFGEFPGKGRGTGGVRCHRFLKGEDCLILAWAGTEPAVAGATSGAPITLPPATGKRDSSGTPGLQPIAWVSSRTTRAIPGMPGVIEPSSGSDAGSESGRDASRDAGSGVEQATPTRARKNSARSTTVSPTAPTSTETTTASTKPQPNISAQVNPNSEFEADNLDDGVLF